MHDVIIIGAGPAGLQAALTLGRMRRTTALIDSGRYRNEHVRHMHNVLAADGTPPTEFRATARRQLAAYPTVTVHDDTVETVRAADAGYEAVFADGSTLRARIVLLATGMLDELPPVPGLDGLWGRRAFNCPFCDGHEFVGRRVGLLGADARIEHLAQLLSPIAAELVVFDDGGLDTGIRSRLLDANVTVHSAPVTAVSETDDGVRVDAGAAVDVAALFLTPRTTRQRAPFAAQLGLRMLPNGAIEIDDVGRTSHAGVFAAGDIAQSATAGGMPSVISAAASGQRAASFITMQLTAGDGQ